LNILHIYPQHEPHDDPFIIGSRNALKALKAAIEDALDAPNDGTADSEVMFTRDGEGYTVLIMVDDSDWQGHQWQDAMFPYANIHFPGLDEPPGIHPRIRYYEKQ
jgi:hypothetical protein